MPTSSRSYPAFLQMPGRPGSTRSVRAQASAAHESLLAAAESAAPASSSLHRLVSLLDEPGVAEIKQRLLCHPLLIAGLHELSKSSAAVECWHNCVTCSGGSPQTTAHGLLGGSALANVLFCMELRANRRRVGASPLYTDLFGTLRFPFSHWSVKLRLTRGDPGERITHRRVTLSLDRARATWTLADDPTPFLISSADDCARMIVDNDPQIELSRLEFPNRNVRPRLQFAPALGVSGVRYDPVFFRSFDEHAGITGAIVEGILEAVRRNSPLIYREFCEYIVAVRGFELPADDAGTLQSFSDPTLPGVMGVNIPYTPAHEPRICSFCFSWFGHELAHSKMYLINDVLYSAGCQLVTNNEQMTDVIPRYGRPLSVRTLIQIPYVHLYEWVLLMDFVDAGFHHLPWTPDEDFVAFGQDLKAEIDEGFELIADWAELTRLGRQMVRHFKLMFQCISDRWNELVALV